MTIDIDAAELIAEELKSEKTFNARDAVTGATYPEDSIDVYSDAKLGHAVNIAAHDAAAARFLADSIKHAYVKAQSELAAESRTVEDDLPVVSDGTDAPGYAEADKEASELEAKVAELLDKLRKSVLTFHLRGLAPEQWRLIHAKWRKEIKEPARKNFDRDEDGEEEFQRVVLERSILRVAAVEEDCIASSIVKVVRKLDGAVDTSVWKQQDVKHINDTYMESEFEKLKNMSAQLTFANNIFKIAVEQDENFLLKP